MELDALLTCARDAVHKAGSHVLDHYGRRNATVSREKHDVKLELDMECQQLINDHIKRVFPSHSILGEEDQHHVENHQARWIVDPIDGTVNLTHGIPLWGPSVAVEVDGHIAAGAFYIPEMNLTYWATSESKAFCNDRVIQPSAIDSLNRSLIIIGLPKTVESDDKPMDLVDYLSPRAQKIRILGSAAVGICFTAEGRAEGYIERGIYIWDVAAAGLVAQRAGARAEILEQAANGRLRYACGNPAMFETLSTISKEYLPL